VNIKEDNRNSDEKKAGLGSGDTPREHRVIPEAI
jgi:hypothetical protein